MGLKERRVLEEIKLKLNSVWLKQIQAAAKFPVKVEVVWESIVKEDNVDYAISSFEKVFVQSLIEAFNEICRDDMGKTAIAKGVKKIVIKNESGISYGNRWAFFNDDGVLTLDHKYSNVDQVSERAKGVVDLLSSKL